MRVYELFVTDRTIHLFNTPEIMNIAHIFMALCASWLRFLISRVSDAWRVTGYINVHDHMHVLMSVLFHALSIKAINPYDICSDCGFSACSFVWRGCRQTGNGSELTDLTIITYVILCIYDMKIEQLATWSMGLKCPLLSKRLVRGGECKIGPM